MIVPRGRTNPSGRPPPRGVHPCTRPRCPDRPDVPLRPRRRCLIPPSLAAIEKRLMLAEHPNGCVEPDENLRGQQRQCVVTDDGHVRLPLDGGLPGRLNGPRDGNREHGRIIIHVIGDLHQGFHRHTTWVAMPPSAFDRPMMRSSLHWGRRPAPTPSTSPTCDQGIDDHTAGGPVTVCESTSVTRPTIS